MKSSLQFNKCLEIFVKKKLIMDIQNFQYQLQHLSIKLSNPVGERFNPRVSQARHTSHRSAHFPAKKLHRRQRSRFERINNRRSEPNAKCFLRRSWRDWTRRRAELSRADSRVATFTSIIERPLPNLFAMHPRSRVSIARCSREERGMIAMNLPWNMLWFSVVICD